MILGPALTRILCGGYRKKRRLDVAVQRLENEVGIDESKQKTSTSVITYGLPWSFYYMNVFFTIFLFAMISVMLGGRPVVAGESVAAYHDRKNIEAFSNAMADIRAAEERCTHTFIDWAAVATWKQRLGVPYIDFFSYQHRAQILLGSLAEDKSIEAWCRDAVDRYGQSGRSLSGMLHH